MRRVVAVVMAVSGLALPCVARAQAPAAASAADPRTVLRAGTVIPAMLVNGVNSDLPGDVLAQVTRDVFDYDQRVLLLPRGARLIGTYGDQVVLGQDRLLVVWTTLQMPDGRTYELPGINGADRTGASGVPGAVDNHYKKVFGTAGLSALMGTAVAMANPEPQGGYGQQLTANQEAQKEVALEADRLSNELLKRNLRIKPTITLPAGKPFLVFVNRDIVLPPWESGS